MRTKRHRLWTSLTAAAAFLPAAPIVVMGLSTAPREAAGPAGGAQERFGSPLILTKGQDDRRQGLASEGGEGGEMGVDSKLAGNDPVVFLTALDIVAAHYHAGLAAYLAGLHREGAEMFLHPISEVYVDVKLAFGKLGVDDFQADMQKAGDLALAGAPDPVVRKAAATVFAAIAQAKAKAPKDARSPDAVAQAVLADMINRAALQYAIVQKEESTEPYLDGFGYYTAAKMDYEALASRLESVDASAAKTVTAAMALLAKAYPSIKRPTAAPLLPGDVLSAASRALLALTP